MPSRTQGVRDVARAGLVRRLFDTTFHIRPEEFGVVQLFFLHFTTIGIFYTVGATASDTMFLSRFSPQRVTALLPWVYIGIAATSILLTWFYDLIQGGVTRLKLLVGSHLTLGISIFLFRYLIAQYQDVTWLYFVFVIWLESCALISIMTFYSYAGDYFTTRDARRLYGYINGGLAFGTLISGYVISPMVRWLGTDNLLFVIGGLQFLSAFWAVIISVVARPVGHREEPVDRDKKAPLRAIFGKPYLLIVMMAVVAGLICFRLSEFQFQITVSRTMQEETLALFFGRFYRYLGIAQVVIQFLVVGWLMDRLGAIKSLSVLPICLLAVSAGFHFHPAVATAALLNFVRLAFSETLDLPARELLFLPLSRRVRLRAQILFGGIVVPLGSGLGGVVILILSMRLTEIHHFAPITAGVALFWIVSLVVLRPFYRRTLARSITAGVLGPTDLRRLVALTGSSTVLRDLLTSERHEHVLCALDLLKLRKLGDLTVQVHRLTDSTDPEIARRAFELLGNDGQRVPIDLLEVGLRDSRPAVRAEAILTYSRTWHEQALPHLRSAMGDRTSICRLAAIVGMIRFGGFDGAMLAYPRLDDMLRSKRGADRVAAAGVLHRIGGAGYEQTIVALLDDRSKEVRRTTALVCAELRLPELIPALVSKMSDPDLRESVIRALESMPPEASAALADLIGDESLSIQDRSSLTAALARIGQPAALSVLFDLVAGEGPILLRSGAARALRIARERKALPEIDKERIRSCLDGLLDSLSFVGTARAETHRLDPRSSTLFLDRCLVIVDIIFSLLLLLTDREELKGIEANLLAPFQTPRDNAMELLSVILPRRLSSQIISPIARALHDLPRDGRGLSDTVRRRLLDSDDWLRCVALYHLGNRKNAKGGGEEVSQNDIKLIAIIDTVSFLKSVDLFKDIPAEHLASLARIAEEISFFKGETLFKEGERGDALYLVEEGQVDVRKGKKELTKLGTGECIGEMALLDGKPRSATCVVVKDAKLLRISSDSFSNLLTSQPEMAKALLRTLAQRLRKVSDRID